MLDCWQVAPQKRPTFTDLSQHLSKLFSDDRVTIRVFVRNGGMMFECLSLSRKNSLKLVLLFIQVAAQERFT